MLSNYQGDKCPIEIFDLLIKKLSDLKFFLENVESPKRLMNTSLMFVFDRDYKPKDKKSVDVKMIDIGHMEKVLEGETQDVGYIKGL